MSYIDIRIGFLKPLNSAINIKVLSVNENNKNDDIVDKFNSYPRLLYLCTCPHINIVFCHMLESYVIGCIHNMCRGDGLCNFLSPVDLERLQRI